LSPKTQRTTYRQLAQTLYAKHGPVKKLLQHVGYPRKQIKRAHRAFKSQHGHVLKLKKWLGSAAGKPYRGLWLGQVSGQNVSLIRILKINQPKRLKALVDNTAGARLIDRPAQISALLGHYRHITGWMLAVAYGLAWLVLTLVLGVRRAALVVAAPLTASLIVTAVFALAGWPFTIFNVMALLLLLGLGADYGIFLNLADRNSAPTMTAVAASMATTVASFGLLGASRTPPLHQFGVTLGLGIVLTFILASTTAAIGRSLGKSRDDDKTD
jgi:predicted exporter